MPTPGTKDNPLRVAIIGAGPSGFYTAQHLLARSGLVVEIDLFDRLPTPFGLVRYGVAPDHQKVKSVAKAYTKVGIRPEVRFFGNVELGKDIEHGELKALYHQVVYTTGAQTDRRLGIPGEDLLGSYPATEFVAWYNGHPDYRHLEFDLSAERAVVIGVGNVAVDVARILCRTPDELARTDIADHALEALRASRVREVHLVGRRGSAQAAFTNTEIKELGQLEDAETLTLADEVAVDGATRAWLDANPSTSAEKKVEILQSYAGDPTGSKHRRLFVRFLLSPVEILSNAVGSTVAGVRLVRNELYLTDDGNIRPRATDLVEELSTGIIFRSVGYRGVPVPGVPFREDWGTVPHDLGRVLDAPDGNAVPGEYVAGWIKRGPSGVIGTNKPDALETVGSMMEDLEAGRIKSLACGDRSAVERHLSQRSCDYFTFDEWQRLDALETRRGEAAGRPRVKFITPQEMRQALLEP